MSLRSWHTVSKLAALLLHAYQLSLTDPYGSGKLFCVGKRREGVNHVFVSKILETNVNMRGNGPNPMAGKRELG